jgi:hypothetical protein
MMLNCERVQTSTNLVAGCCARRLQDAEDFPSRFGHHRGNVAQLEAVAKSAARAAELTRALCRRHNEPGRSLGHRTPAPIDPIEPFPSPAMLGDYVALQKSLGLGWQDAMS